jgi:UDP-GlcNAc:undecaprenyl-phosphate GlcNAc-1-phosphate transferase
VPDVVTRNLPEPSVVYAFVIALGFVALVATPAVIALARRLGVLALPGGRRIHSQPVPLLGGVAIVSAVLLAAAPNLPVLNPQLAAILVGAVLMCLVGALDDALHLGAATKLVAQSGCALLPIVEGVTIDHFTIPLVPPVSLGALQYPVTLVFIVAIANTVNLIDGLDGLAAGLGAISALTFAVLAVSLGRNQSAVLAAALAGACLGFLPWNFHPAKVFMGDSGSLPVGFLLATLSIHGVMKTAAALAVIFPIVVMLVPILDTSFVVLKRLKYGRSIMSGDQNHFHHRMLRIGYSQRRAAVLLYLWCGILATFALAVRFLRPHTPGQWHVGPTIALSIFGLIALAVSVYVVYSLEILKYRHLRLIGFARRVDVSGDVPLAARRRAPDGVPTRPTDGIPSGS